MNYKNKEMKENNFRGLVAERNTKKDYTEKRKQTIDRKEMVFRVLGSSFKIIKIGNVFEFLVSTTDDNGKDRITRVVVKQDATTEENKSTISYLKALKTLKEEKSVAYNTLELLVNSVIESKSDIDLFYKLLFVLRVNQHPLMTTTISSVGKGSIDVKYNYQRLGFTSEYDMMEQLRREWFNSYENKNQIPQPQHNHGKGTLYVNGLTQQPMFPINISIDEFLFKIAYKGLLVSRIINLLSIDYLKLLDWENSYRNDILDNRPKPLILDIINDSFDSLDSLLFIEENIMTEKFMSLGFISNTLNKRYFSNYVINSLLGRYVGNDQYTIIPNYGAEIKKNDKNQLLLSFSVRDINVGITRKDYLIVYEWENIPNSTLQKLRVDLTLQNQDQEDENKK